MKSPIIFKYNSLPLLNIGQFYIAVLGKWKLTFLLNHPVSNCKLNSAFVETIDFSGQPFPKIPIFTAQIELHCFPLFAAGSFVLFLALCSKFCNYRVFRLIWIFYAFILMITLQTDLFCQETQKKCIFVAKIDHIFMYFGGAKISF